MSPLPPIDRPLSRVSLAPSDTTYHSFHDIERHDPHNTSHLDSERTGRKSAPAPKHHSAPIIQEIRRQDSGYESMAGRDSHSSRRRTSSASISSSTRRQRPKSSTHRPSKSGPVSQVPRRCHQSKSSTSSYPPSPQQQHQPVTYFQFPRFITAEPEDEGTEMTLTRNYASGSCYPPTPESPAYPLPPQTTHYWTSDRTRRLEYAAIDAASRGVRGWVRRHIVPECFAPKAKRRIGFEDDRGSVVRYRLELEADDEAEKSSGGPRKRRRGWWFAMHRD